MIGSIIMGGVVALFVGAIAFCAVGFIRIVKMGDAVKAAIDDQHTFLMEWIRADVMDYIAKETARVSLEIDVNGSYSTYDRHPLGFDYKSFLRARNGQVFNLQALRDLRNA